MVREATSSGSMSSAVTVYTDVPIAMEFSMVTVASRLVKDGSVPVKIQTTAQQTEYGHKLNPNSFRMIRSRIREKKLDNIRKIKL